MDRKVAWSTEALDDVEAIAEYIERDSAFYAQAATTAILEMAGSIGRFPLMGKVVPEMGSQNIREWFVYSHRVHYCPHVSLLLSWPGYVWFDCFPDTGVFRTGGCRDTILGRVNDGEAGIGAEGMDRSRWGCLLVVGLYVVVAMVLPLSGDEPAAEPNDARLPSGQFAAGLLLALGFVCVWWSEIQGDALWMGRGAWNPIPRRAAW
mgnify:CR=1 FL=1